ncbi:RNA-directed DNA polymerase, eukaryota, reverse transcriptase zinc-binding domain protein [Tanacetum coccineum]
MCCIDRYPIDWLMTRVLGLGGGGERKKKKKDDVHSCIPDVLKTRPISYSNVKSAVPPGESTDHLGVFTFGLVPTSMPMHNITVTPINESFDVKNREKIVSPTSTTMDNIRKLKANVPNDADYDVWLPLASVHEFSSTKGFDLVLKDGQWMIRGVPIFLNKWYPSVSLFKEDLSRVPVWVKFRDVLLVFYIPHGLSLIATKISNPMMLDWYTNSMCLESWGRSDYARILIEINTCNGFSSNLVMAVPNLDGTGYRKETIRVEYEWKPLCCSNDTFSFSNSFEDLNFDNLAIKEVDLGNKASTSGVQKEGQSSTPLVEKIKKFEQLMLEGKCVLVDDDGNPLEMVDYSSDHDREDKVAPLDNEMASFLASQLLGVVYGTNSLLEQ